MLERLKPSPKTIQEVVRDHALEVLRLCNGNKMMAARELGIDRRTLYRWLKRDFDVTVEKRS